MFMTKSCSVSRFPCRRTVQTRSVACRLSQKSLPEWDSKTLTYLTVVPNKLRIMLPATKHWKSSSLPPHYLPEWDSKI